MSNHIEVNPENQWRLEGTEPAGWAKSVKPYDPNKYYIVSCDNHLNPPATLFEDRLDKKWSDLYISLNDSKKYTFNSEEYHGEDLARQKAGAIAIPGHYDDTYGWKRITDQEADGVDAEILFGNGAALLVWASDNNDFVQAKCEVWNDWAWETCKDYIHRSHPVANIMTADVDMAVKEVQRVAKMGYKIVALPCKPKFGPELKGDPDYNRSNYDPLWAAIQDADLTITFHAFTGKDSGTFQGPGSAITNYVWHSITPMAPIVHLCASGVFERFPKLRAASIESDAGWVPWTLEKMDETVRKHHFRMYPKLKELPSQYYKNNCYCSFGEDVSAVSLIEQFGLENNFMWANDYPHHEGSWPHSEQSIYRTLGDRLQEETRAKVLGLNAAKCFGLEIPAKYR